MKLLDFYLSRFGQAVKRQGNGHNGPCPLCGGEPGRSDRFVVWPDRSDHLGEVCTRHGLSGIWSCRQCGESGDTIAYLTKCEGMSFAEALAELGLEPEKRPYRPKKAPQEPPAPAVFRPKDLPPPTPEWQEKAQKLIEEASEKIWEAQAPLRWLHERGINDDAIRAYRLGYLPEESAKYHGRFRPRKAFGLPDKTGEDGQIQSKLFIPRGIVIPTFASDGQPLNLRIRRHKSDLEAGRAKYLELTGSSHCPLFLASSLPAALAVYFVTEAELDAMLIHYASGGVVGALAVRTNRGKPDSKAHQILQKAARICIALDYDSAGAEGVSFWEETYPQAMRWPVPEGKDPGDAFALGVNIRDWVAASLPESVKLPEEAAIHGCIIAQSGQEIQATGKNGHPDALAFGSENLGGGENSETPCGKWPSANRARYESRAENCLATEEFGSWRKQPQELVWAKRADFTQAELGKLDKALPPSIPLERVYLDVAVIWLLWQGTPIAFVCKYNQNGILSGYSWDMPDGWLLKNAARFDQFWRHQRVSQAFWSWMNDHPASRITAKNLLLMPDLLLEENIHG